MATTAKPWDGSASRWPNAGAYCDACLINENTGPRSGWTKDKCHLPVKEPDGRVNLRALAAAAARLNQTKASPASLAAAKAKLRRLYAQNHMTLPESLK